MNAENQKIVIDSGSGYTKVGLSGDKNPRVCIPTAIARHSSSAASDLSCLIMGEEALNPPDEYIINRPISNGIITDWDLMESYWTFIFNDKLNINPEGSSIFMTEKYGLPTSEREKKAEILFEKFKTSSIFISNGATPILWGSRIMSGIVMDFGYDCTQIVPMRNGFGFKVAVQDCDLGGKDISQYLFTLLSKKNIKRISELDLENIKKKFCFCKTSDSSKEEVLKEIEYQLLDNSKIILGDERFLCTEIFFTPLFGKGSIFQYFIRSLYEADKETKSKFPRTVVIAGGNSIFPGLKEEITKAFQSYEKLTQKMNIIIKEEREFVQFFGASEHSAESYINSRLMTRSDYDELGAALGVRKKFFYI